MPTRTTAPAMPMPVSLTPKSSAAKLTVWVNSVLTNAALIEAAASSPTTSSWVESRRSGGAHQRPVRALAGQRPAGPAIGTASRTRGCRPGSGWSRRGRPAFGGDGAPVRRERPVVSGRMRRSRRVPSPSSPARSPARWRRSRGRGRRAGCRVVLARQAVSGHRRMRVRPPGSTPGAYWWAMNSNPQPRDDRSPQ